MNLMVFSIYQRSLVEPGVSPPLTTYTALRSTGFPMKQGGATIAPTYHPLHPPPKELKYKLKDKN